MLEYVRGEVTQEHMNCAAIFMSILKVSIKKKRRRQAKIRGSMKCLKCLEKHKYAFHLLIFTRQAEMITYLGK